MVVLLIHTNGWVKYLAITPYSYRECKGKKDENHRKGMG